MRRSDRLLSLPAGTSKLAGHKAFQVSTDLSLLGRSVDIYVKDGKVFGVPCYAVDEIYYTFADASQLKEICQGGGFRLTDETEYYYKLRPLVQGDPERRDRQRQDHRDRP